ncbi:ubiquitin-specific protease doa4, partial [Borealophlyctis nickersoniae]
MAGLKNIGNTCFMNSVIQCLSATVPLSRYFLDGSYRKHLNRTNPLGTRGAIADTYAHLIRTMWSESESVVVPSKFKETVGDHHPAFRGNEQQDSQEFLGFVLDRLHEDLNVARRGKVVADKEPDDEEEGVPDEVLREEAWKRYRKLNWSIIVDMFQGSLKSKLQCMTCGKTSTTFNPFMYLTLPVPEKGKPVTLEQCLNKFVEEEILDGDDRWRCPRCKVPRRTRKQLTIARLPVILLIHLKRFYFQGPFRNRIDTYVEFPITGLDLTSYLPPQRRIQSPPMPHQQQQQIPGIPPPLPAKPDVYLYDLYAVSNHYGGLNGGHYTAQIKNGYKQRWYNFDDSRISETSVDSVK